MVGDTLSQGGGQQLFSPIPGAPVGPAVCDGLPGLRVGLLLAEEEQSVFILSSQMLVMLPPFLFTEANSKHLLLFKFSDMRHGEANFCATPSPKAAGPCPGGMRVASCSGTPERDRGVQGSVCAMGTSVRLGGNTPAGWCAR